MRGLEYHRTVAMVVVATSEANSRRCHTRPLSAQSTMRSAGLYSAFPEIYNRQNPPLEEKPL